MPEMDRALFTETLAAAKAGDEPAFTALFRATQPALLRYLSVLAGPRAEDIAGETWVQVVKGLPAFAAEELPAFRAWVLTIARHRWLDDRRARSRRPEQLVPDAPEQPSGEDVGAIVAGMVATETAISFIRALPPDQAEVLMLRVVADLDVATTAAVMGREPGSVRVLAHRGLRRLRHLLEAAQPGTPDVTARRRRAVSE